MRVKKVAIIGAGTIGRGWIPLFARAGMEVRVFDPCTENRHAALAASELTLRDLASYGLVADAQAAFRLVRPVDSLHAALDGVDYAQESAPEDVVTKQAVNRRANGTPYRRAKGTPFSRWRKVDRTRALALRAA